MKKSGYLIVTLLIISTVCIQAPVSYSQEEPTATEAQKKVVPPCKFNSIIPQITSSTDAAPLRDLINGSFDECCVFENYEKFISDSNAVLAAEPGLKNRDYLNFAMARARYDQLSCLSKNNDIEAGRLYMSVNDRYFTEAMGLLDGVDSTTKSGSLLVDSNLLRYLIYREKMQPEKSEAVFDVLASKIAKFSEDKEANKNELEYVFNMLKKLGMSKQAIKLKVLYASKVDPETAKEIIEEIRKSADRYFEQNDMREASELYEQYMATASAYYEKAVMGAKLMEIGEKYFVSGRYKDAKKYYNLYMDKYSDLGPADYCAYKLALCSYYMKDHIRTIAQLEAFLEKYKNSAWFDKAFEMLARVYYENLPREKALESLQSIIDKYYRKGAGDYAKILMAMLYYKAMNYDMAEETLKKIEPSSSCYFAAKTIMDDINEIRKNKTAPVFGTDASESYKLWDVYQGLDVKIAPTISGRSDAIPVTASADGSMQMEVPAGTKVQFSLQGLVDDDRFNEYTIDKEDQSRLPKMIKEETEKDLLMLHWSVDGGNFSDDKETDTKTWQAPGEPGIYKLKISVDDFGVVRVPNKGVRKDLAKDTILNIVVK